MENKEVVGKASYGPPVTYDYLIALEKVLKEADSLRDRLKLEEAVREAKRLGDTVTSNAELL